MPMPHATRHRSLVARYSIVSLALAVLPLSIPAAEFTVTSRLDSGAGTLRAAIMAANVAPNPPHVIRFQDPYPLGGRIVLESNLPTIVQALEIDGGNRFAQVSGNELFPVLRAQAALTIRNLQLRDGWAPVTTTTAGNGGCIRFNGAPGPTMNLLVENATFENCAAQALAFPSGGAIHWLSGSGTVTIRNSLFTLNFAASNDPAGEQPRGGAVAATGNILIEDSTFENNQVVAFGSNDGGFGGALQLSAIADGTVTVRRNRLRFNRVTPDAANLGTGGAMDIGGAANASILVENNWFRSNEARRGGAIHMVMTGTGASATVRNNTFQDNESVDGGHLSVFGWRLFAQHNTFDDGRATNGGHLRLEGTDVRQFSNNLMTRFTGNGMCVSIAINRTNLLGAGNVLRAACSGLELGDDQFLATDPVAERDETVRIGILRYANDLRIVDRANDEPEHCLDTDARNGNRPLDGDADGASECDPGAHEHAIPRIFGNGFESSVIQ